MEEIKDLKDFIIISSSSGDGSGDGSGCGYNDCYGSGCGYSSGSDRGSDRGSGYGYGSGSGSDRGSGYGYGSGSGRGSARGSGYGYGYDYGGIKKINGILVNLIDDIPTIISAVRGNIAKGFILNNDLTLSRCFVAKDNNLFAHGKTLKEAVRALQEKKLECLDVDETIEKFCKEFEKDKKYQASVFCDWHHYLTGSCEMGRKSFADNHGIDLENDYFTVNEFIKLTINDYGGEVIEKLKRVWENGN